MQEPSGHNHSESVSATTTWTNPYRYDGRDGVRYDGETGLYWMAVRAYDPGLGRFLSRDPLGRAPRFFSDQPYGYTANNPLRYVDPSGQRRVCDGDCLPTLPPTPPKPPTPTGGSGCHSDGSCGCYSTCGGGGGKGGGGGNNGGGGVTCNRDCKINHAKDVAGDTSHTFSRYASFLNGALIVLSLVAVAIETVGAFLDACGALQICGSGVGVGLGVTLNLIGAEVGIADAGVGGLYIEAGMLASDFSYNNSWSSPERWTIKHLEQFRLDELQITAIGYAVSSTLFSIGQFIAGLPNPDQVFPRFGFNPAIDALRYLIGVGPLITGYAGEVANLHFQNLAMAAINQEESYIM